MGLIKAIHAPAAAERFSMRDIERQAAAMLLRAQQQAEQLLAEAQAEAEQLKQRAARQGREEGWQQGHAEGLEEGREAGRRTAFDEHCIELARLTGALTTAMGDIDSSRQMLEAQALHDVVSLAIAIARRVTKQRAAADADVLRSNVEESLKLVLRMNRVRIAVNPEQREILEEVLPKLQAHIADLEHVEIIEDAAVLPGGCRVYTLHGMIDANIDTQLDRVAANLLPTGEESAG